MGSISRSQSLQNLNSTKFSKSRYPKYCIQSYFEKKLKIHDLFM